MAKEKEQLPAPELVPLKKQDLVVPEKIVPQKEGAPETKKPTDKKIAGKAVSGLLSRLRLRKKGQDESLDQELRTIYADEDGAMPDLRTVDRAQTNRLRNVLIGLVIFFGLLATAAWAGFFLFQPGAFRGEGIRMTVTSAEPFVAGDEAVVKVRYTNGERVALGAFEVTVTLPDGFTMTSAEPAPTEGLRWVRGAVGSGQSGEIVIRGKVTEGIGSILPFSAYASYIPAGFNSEFQTVGALQATVTDAVLGLAVSGPDKIPAGDAATYVVRWENRGDQALADAVVELSLPADFLPELITPEPRVEDKRIVLNELTPGASGEITILGAYASEASGAHNVAAGAGVLRDQHLSRYASASTTTDVVGGALVLTTVTNGIASSGRVAFGNRLRTSLTYENRGTVDLTGVEITLVYEPRPATGLVQFDTLNDELDGVRRDGRITWTKNEIPRLAKLAPGDEGTIDVDVVLANKPGSLTDRLYGIDISAEAKIAKIGDLPSGRVIKSGKNMLAVNSDLECLVEARYFNDDEIAVGSGPVPPRVGSATTYRLFYTLTNSLHELTNLVLRVPLAPRVRFAERVQTSAGEVRYDATSSTVVWNLNRLPVGIASVDGSFDLLFEPSEEDVGRVPPLTGLLSCEALDASAGGVIVHQFDSLTTNLDGDPQAEGRGTVQVAE